MTSLKTAAKNISPVVQGPCYCLGARHRVITNCLECGYLLCEQDANPGIILLPNIQQQSTATLSVGGNTTNYSSLFCPSCQVPCILPYSAAEARALYGTDSIETTRYVRAYEMKDKLLQFDQEHAQRTRVYDAQGDYYNAAGNMSWLNEQEKARLEGVEKKRRELLTQRSRIGRKVNIVFNIAGQRVVDVDPYLDLDDDNEDEDDEYNEEHNGKNEDKIEKQRLLVCKAILDERDLGHIDATSGLAGSSWALGSLKDSLAQDINGDAKNPQTIDDINLLSIEKRNVETEHNDPLLANGLENTSMQLQSTRAAETYRFMRQNFQQLVSSSTPNSLSTAPDKEQTKHLKKTHTNNSNVVLGKDEKKHQQHSDADFVVASSSFNVNKNNKKTRNAHNVNSNPPKCDSSDPITEDNHSRKTKIASKDHRQLKKNHGQDQSQVQVSNDGSV